MTMANNPPNPKFIGSDVQRFGYGSIAIQGMELMGRPEKEVCAQLDELGIPWRVKTRNRVVESAGTDVNMNRFSLHIEDDLVITAVKG